MIVLAFNYHLSIITIMGESDKAVINQYFIKCQMRSEADTKQIK